MVSSINLKSIDIGSGRSARLFRPDTRKIAELRSAPIRTAPSNLLNTGALYLVSKGVLDMDSCVIHPDQIADLVNHGNGLKALKKSGLKVRAYFDTDMSPEEEALRAIYGRLLPPVEGLFVSRYKSAEEHSAAEKAVRAVLEGDAGEFGRAIKEKKGSFSTEPVDLSGAFLTFGSFAGWDLSFVNLYGSFLTGADFSESTCIYVNFEKARLAGCSFKGANIKNCNFIGADLSFADLSGSDLKGSAVSGTSFMGADLSFCDLSGLSFLSEDLRQARLTGSILNGTDLSMADLRGADLTGLDLFGIDLERARLSRAKIDLSNRQFMTAQVLSRNTDIDWQP